MAPLRLLPLAPIPCSPKRKRTVRQSVRRQEQHQPRRGQRRAIRLETITIDYEAAYQLPLPFIF